MEYKGYTAKIEFDADDRAFHGMVLGINDVVHFQGASVKELEKEFRASVDDYLEFCKARREKPDKPYSGKLVFRTSSELHRKIAIAAQLAGKSINQFLEDAALKQATKEKSA
ncbi:MAG: type II toxin-antitoxin system HicB family antitoxin [Alphaproteobacteria bacterium]|nr:type II toxin-antitoxin system HicB family antitoxin [Alphaproteobacteria bacterium]